MDRVLADYPVAGPTVVKQFEASTRNDNWLIEDAGSRRYVLRRHRQHRRVDRVTFQLRFQQHLQSHGFPTPQVVETRGGGTIVVGSDGLPWSLHTHIDGTFYEFDQMEQVVEAAHRLTQFHALAETFGSGEVIVDYAPSIYRWWVDTEEDLHALSEMMGPSAGDEEMGFVRDWWSWVLAEWPLERVEALPVGWLHGDYHGRNMLFVWGKMQGLFDFDDLNRGPMIFDIARGMHMFGRESRNSLRIRPDVARRFVREYAQGRALTGEELAALPMMVAMYYPPTARYYRYCQQLGEDIGARLRRDVGTMRTLRSQIPEIAAIAASM